MIGHSSQVLPDVRGWLGATVHVANKLKIPYGPICYGENNRVVCLMEKRRVDGSGGWTLCVRGCSALKCL